MSWVKFYETPTATTWQGREDTPPGNAFFQHIQLVNDIHSLPTPKEPSFALIGFCCDEGIRRNFGRTGAAHGPHAIREQLAKLAWHRQGIACYDVGNVVCFEQHLEEAQFTLAKIITQLLTKQFVPIVLGGGHELAWGHFQGILNANPNQSINLLNLDAHLDMRPFVSNTWGNSGTPFLQIAKACEQHRQPFHYYCLGAQSFANQPALLETAHQYQVDLLFADEIHTSSESAPRFINHLLQTERRIYLSFCLDVFSAAHAPGVSAPQPFGLMPQQLFPWFRTLLASGKIISYDLAELSPKYDEQQRTAKLAAYLVNDIIHHHAFMT